ncbi:MAG: zf-HC2 domain-containing protein [bacterium]
MNCEEYQYQISQLVDNELGEDSSCALFYHLHTCSECRHFFKSLLHLHSGVQSLPTIKVSDEVVKKVQYGYLHQMKHNAARSIQDPRVRRRKAVSRFIHASMLLMIILFVGIIASTSVIVVQPQNEISPSIGNSQTR